MATSLGRALHALLPDLRTEPTAKRVTARVGGHPVLRTDRALLVWEPGRVVPQYAVPEADLAAELVPAPQDAAVEVEWVSLPDGTRILPPGPFGAHTTAGQPLTVRAGAVELPGAAFRADDPDLAGYVILDFTAFDEWYDDDEPLVAHLPPAGRRGPGTHGAECDPDRVRLQGRGVVTPLRLLAGNRSFRAVRLGVSQPGPTGY